MSVDQDGRPESKKFKPAGICRRSAYHSQSTSPDHAVTEFRCEPANAERDRMYTRLSSVVERCPSYAAVVAMSGYMLTYRAPLPSATLLRTRMLSSRASVSGSVVSNHQASTPIWKSALFISFHTYCRALGLKASYSAVPNGWNSVGAIVR